MTNEEKEQLNEMLGQLDALREQVDAAAAKAKTLLGDLDKFIKDGVGTPQGVGTRNQ